MLNIKEIKEIIPHRYPFLLVDRIIELEEGKPLFRFHRRRQPLHRNSQRIHYRRQFLCGGKGLVRQRVRAVLGIPLRDGIRGGLPLLPRRFHQLCYRKRCGRRDLYQQYVRHPFHQPDDLCGRSDQVRKDECRGSERKACRFA